jgi:glycine/D-amino acid oxidase-like deaminating enzyme
MDLMVTEDIQNHLLDRLKTNILPNQSFTIGYQWAGIMGVGEDKHPIITQTSPNVFAAVRMGGMGVAIGSLVGLKLSNLMINGK